MCHYREPIHKIYTKSTKYIHKIHAQNAFVKLKGRYQTKFSREKKPFFLTDIISALGATGPFFFSSFNSSLPSGP